MLICQEPFDQSGSFFVFFFAEIEATNHKYCKKHNSCEIKVYIKL